MTERVLFFGLFQSERGKGAAAAVGEFLRRRRAARIERQLYQAPEVDFDAFDAGLDTPGARAARELEKSRE